MHPAKAAVRRRISASLAVTLTMLPAMLLATWATPADAAVTGPDLRVSVGGNFPSGPVLGLGFSNVGTASAEGITHLTLDTPAGITVLPGSVYIPRGASAVAYSLASEVSPDGRHVDVWFTGAVPVGGSFGFA